LQPVVRQPSFCRTLTAAMIEMSNDRIRDLRVRLILSPLFGVIVPTFSGMVDFRRHTALGLVASYFLFSSVAFLVWEGNRRLYYRFSRREDWLERPWQRAALLLGLVLAFTIPVSTLFLLAWQRLTGDHGVRSLAVPTAVISIVAIASLITYVYETVFLVQDWESARLKHARAESARLAAELDLLTREVDPHFLFNNLHALHHLVDHHDPRAGAFIEALSETYRYVLTTARDRPLVPLAEELQALERHRLLATTRYGGHVKVLVDVPDEAAMSAMVPPVSLGELLLNALKHNVVSAEHPLTLTVTLEDDVLVVTNTIRRKAQTAASTGVGLQNLAERVRLAAGKTLTWAEEGDRFVVRMPISSG
jgi:two-component system LytT family sensor kinase